MPIGDLTEPERQIWEAFARGLPVELGDADPTADGTTAADWPPSQRVRAELLTRLLLGAAATEPGYTPRLHLTGARITGLLDLSGGTVACELRLTRCWLDEPLEASDAKLRNVTLQACRISRIELWAADVDGSVTVTDSLVGELNLGSAHIRSELHLSGTTLSNPGGRALSAAGLTVEQTVYCTKGFHATGEVRFRRARVHGQLMFDGDIDGVLDLSDARVNTLVLPSSNPVPTRLNGLTYQHLAPEELERARIGWLRRDPHGYRAQPYEQLADHFRRLGYDRRARMVMLAKRRAHCRRLPPRWRLLARVQDALSGYGYAPGRAVGWLIAAWVVGAAYFAAVPPDGDGPFHATLYALDVLLPTSPFRLEDRFAPEGAGFWIAIGMQALGWALSIAVLPALTRALSRN
jgi:hypothetical protein